MSWRRSRRGGHLQAQQRQAVIEIGPEAPLPHLLHEVFPGRADHPGVDGHGPVPAKAEDLAAFQDTQEPDLHGGADVRDLVQEDGAILRQFEQALLAAATGAGERPLGIAEQLALQQAFRQGTAVDGHEGRVAPGAGIVDGMRQQFLACPAFPVDVYPRVGLGETLGVYPQGLHGRALAKKVVQREPGPQACLAGMLEAPLQIRQDDIGRQDAQGAFLDPIDHYGAAGEDKILAVLPFQGTFCGPSRFQAFGEAEVL